MEGQKGRNEVLRRQLGLGLQCSGGRTGHIAPAALMSNFGCPLSLLPLLPLPAAVVPDVRLSGGGPVQFIVPVAVEVESPWLPLDSEKCRRRCSLPSARCHV